jgi:hypothetical protein
VTAAAHGPTPRPRGELSLVPDVPRQVRKITVEVEQLSNGLLRFSMPRAPGWVQAGKSPVDVVRILRAAFAERQIVAHSDWKGTVYDHPAAPQLKRSKPRSRGKRRCDVADPTMWLLDERGAWISPKGHRYPEATDVVRRVIRARRAMGLPDRPSYADGRQRLEAIIGTQLALDVDALIAAGES